MESIQQAVEKSRSGRGANLSVAETVGSPLRRLDPDVVTANPAVAEVPELPLDPGYLLSQRVVSHDVANPHSRAYDMLRIHVLRTMETKSWRVLGITSASPQCGKTVTAVNLALSIVRRPNHSVFLIDADMQRPRVSDCIGVIPAGEGLSDVLQGRASLQNQVFRVRAGEQRITCLPTAATQNSSELLGCQAMQRLLQDVKRSYPAHYILLDLPPVLTGSDVISVLPQLDCVLLVAAVGQSKPQEVEECISHLGSSNLIRVVVNKSTEASALPYYY